MIILTEAYVEQAALDSGCPFSAGRLPTGRTAAPRDALCRARRLRASCVGLTVAGYLSHTNAALPASALDHAFCKLTRPQGATLEARNHVSHQLRTTRFEHHGRPPRDTQRRLW